MTVEVSEGAVRLQPYCPLGAEWFAQRMLRPWDVPAATIDGEPVELEPALARAAELLRGARRPLLHGFENATVEDARAAVALADRIGALVSTRDVGGPWPGAPAVSLRGASTATLGEIRDRSQLVVIWREDPETTHPRLLERLGLDRGSGSQRVLVVIDDQDTATARRAEMRLMWTRERDLEALTSLHMLEKGLVVDDPSAALRELMARLKSTQHAAFVYGQGLSAGAGGQRRALALHELVRALCRDRHAVTLELPRAAGTRGADDVLVWQSGYSGHVDFAGGHPELVIAAQSFDDVDLTLRVESGADGSVVTGSGAEVRIRTAAAGVSAGGTVHRLDGVPLALQVPRPDNEPSAAAVLGRLLAEIER